MQCLPADISDFVKKKALETGFDDCGIAKIEHLRSEKENFELWLQKGFNAKMLYMENHFEKRLNPNLLFQNAKSMICLLTSYNIAAEQKKGSLKIARYAFFNDYHEIIRKNLNRLMMILQSRFPNIKGRVFVDSAPILERAWAVRAGLGWIGKSSAFISKKFGSFVFLSEIILDIEMNYDKPLVGNACGACNHCIANCPNGAIIKPYVLNAQKCISFQTIENKGEITEPTHGWLFGCDRCLQVCPYNKHAKIPNNPQFEPISEILNFTKTDWEQLNKDDFKRIFKQSPINRAKFEGIKRNLLFINNNKDEKNTDTDSDSV